MLLSLLRAITLTHTLLTFLKPSLKNKAKLIIFYKDIKIYKTHKLTLRSDIFNVLNLLNYKWGGYNQIINTNLYNVTGFDQATKSYNYSVNTNAGTRSKTASYYSVQFGLRYSF